MLLLIMVLIFAAVSLLAWEILRPKPNPVAERIASNASPAPSSRNLEGSLLHRTLGPMLHRIGGILAKLLPTNAVNGVERMLIMANSPMPLPRFLALWGAAVAGAALVVFYVAAARPDTTSLQVFGFALAAMPVPLFGPYVALRARVRARQKAIIRTLPDALDLLVTGVEAGLGVDAAFAMVAEKSSGPVAEVFNTYLAQVSLGRDRGEALNFVAERTGVPELKRIAVSVMHGEAMGTTLGDVLRTQAEDLRLERKNRAQEAAHRAPALMTIPLVLCFLPAMGLIVVVPALLNLLDFIGSTGG